MDDRSVLRAPIRSGPEFQEAVHEGYVVSTFDNDRRPVRLARLKACAVGQGMQLYTEDEPTLVELRTTTAVLHIRRLS